MQPQLERLARKEYAASDACSRLCWATKGDWLTTLERGAPIDTPPAYDLIHEAAGISHVLLAFAERKLISAAEVKHVADVKARQAIVSLNPHSRDERCTMTVDVAAGAVLPAAAVE